MKIHLNDSFELTLITWIHKIHPIDLTPSGCLSWYDEINIIPFKIKHLYTQKKQTLTEHYITISLNKQILRLKLLIIKNINQI